MKKQAMIILIGLGVSFPFHAIADTCPSVSQFPSPTTPPAGWTILIPAIFPGQDYHFSAATHSLNPTYYNLQVLCLYECSPDKTDCSPFTIISNAQYKQPANSVAPWNVLPQFANTLTCTPADHNPLTCLFSNIPGDQT